MKAAFLIILGIVLLMYHSGFVDDLERSVSDEFNLSFEWTWDLLLVLLWVLIAWLFVDAALIIALSFKMDGYTLSDVMARLNAIEKRLPAQQRVRTPVVMPVVEEIPAEPPVEEPEPELEEDEEEPPPPLE